MRFGSVCSGIEAASVAWHPIGWEAAWLSEIEPFPSAVLKHHYPDVPNLGDMTALPDRIASGEVEAPDLFCGGTPCQAFSVAGLRKSLDDSRGNLSLVFCEIANAIDAVRTTGELPPAIIFWENVPGVLSTKDNAFGCFLAGLAGEDGAVEPPGGKWTNAGCVFGPQRTVAWRVLDAQHFGVAQRRRRVFVVASAREGFDPAAVLFEFQGVRRDSAPSREAGQGFASTAGTLTANGGGLNRPAGNANELDFCIPVGGRSDLTPHGIGANGECARALTAPHTATGRLDPHEQTFVSQPIASAEITGSLTVGTHDCAGHQHRQGDNSFLVTQPIAFHPTQDPINSVEVCHSIGTGNRQGCATAAVAFDAYNQKQSDTAASLRCAAGGVFDNTVMQQMAVRRLTPVECERLQGFPDNYTAIPWRKKPATECPDGPRYKALGNSWAVPVVRWIGQRIKKIGRAHV